MNGTYLVIEIDGEVIAEATNVNLKVIADSLDKTSKDDGLNGTFLAGLVKIGLAGEFLLASDSSNWDKLYDLLSTRDQAVVTLFFDGVEKLGGFGIVKKLSMTGANSDSLVTGKWGIRYYVSTISSELTIETEAGFTIITESGETIITE